eukprot:CAMPEP_0168477224 /NCGR_PEP_ID=MMETSP0228-20121227/62297_1 /TAXON_ID=133427 /ORGANISM="Protoceratium reticulatum, Strain CCCM 535 (=CCMP 1889)" /LENGTH=923 /DNA_ID=CAMNT_0008493377 /DNA_START=1 /DNA_END=2772 /DNA_ORIENTATION=+
MAWCCLQFFTQRTFLVTLLVTFLLDVLACLSVLLLAKSSGAESRDASLYGSKATDTLTCCLVRIVVVPALSGLALLVYRRTAAASPLARLEQAAEVPSPTGLPTGTTGLDVPLRQAEAGASFSSTGSGSLAAPAGSLFELQRDHALLMKRADRRRTVIMAFTYVIVTGMSMYNGLKCVGFHYDPQLVVPQGTLFGLIMVLINLEYFLILDFLGKLTEEKGDLIPHLHMHPLFFALGLKCHHCDICHEATKGPHYIAYRCRTCDFDLCPRCHRKKDDPNARGYGARSVRRDGEQLTTWSYFRRILMLTAEFGNTSALAIVCLVATQSMLIWAPSIQGSIFDGIIHYLQDPGKGRAAFEHAMFMYLLVNGLQGLFGSLKSYAQDMVLRQLACSVRTKLFQSVIRLDVAFFDTMHTGQITSRLTNDASQMVQPLNTLLNDLVANLMLLVGGMIFAFKTSWKLSILALTVVPPISYCYRQYAQWGRKVNRSIYCAYGEANSAATEAIHNIRTVKGFSTERHEMDKYDDSIGTALSHGKKNAYVGASVSAFSTYLNNGTALLILWYGGTLVCDSGGKAMSIGSLITFQLYWNMMNSAFISLGNVFNDLIRSSSAAERVISLIDARPEVDPDEGEAVEAASVAGHLELRGVEFRYKTRAENLVLKGINLDMAPGTVTALVGKSGGGKSTLVHLLMRFYEPTGGSIFLDGKDMRSLSSRSVRAFCGFVAQDTQLFAKSIEENLSYGLGRAHTEEELHAACRAANAHEFILETEEGYQTRVGERGMLLSGGQRQRLAIARCFLRRPRLLFLDEATSALDAENEALVQQALDTLIEEVKCTVVLIAHRLSTVINSNKIAVVHKGSIVEHGTHDELVTTGGIYAQLVHRQLSRDASAVIDKQSSTGAAGSGAGLQTEIDQLMEEMEGAGGLGG